MRQPVIPTPTYTRRLSKPPQEGGTAIDSVFGHICVPCETADTIFLPGACYRGSTDHVPIDVSGVIN